MQKLERVNLLSSTKDIGYLLSLFFAVFLLSMLWQFHNYKELTKFNYQIVHATILKQYTKTKITKRGKHRTYQVLKIKSDNGFTFYTTASKKLPFFKGHHVTLQIWARKVTFLAYMKGFYAFSKILKVETLPSRKELLSNIIAMQHKDNNATQIYQALYLAKPLPYTLQQQFSNLGISHLIAISGFHLGVLSALLFFLIKYPYKFFQERYFPYRNYHRDTFFIITLLLLSYLLFLDTPPSLLRAFVMFIVGFVLYERGIKIISMQTLLLTILLIIALFPRLLFSIGFFLSVAGVFYIFLFLIYMKQLKPLYQFFLLPFWVYLLMLPYSLAIFDNFSLYHPLSILWTSLFTLFYPLSIFLHFIGFGGIFDGWLHYLTSCNTHAIKIILEMKYLYIEIAFSLLAIFNKKALYLLLFYCLAIFIYAIYHIT